MRNQDHGKFKSLENTLMKFHAQVRPLPGIQPMENRISFIRQLIDSLRRVRYVHVIREMNHSPLRSDPSSPMFDPLRAAVLAARKGDYEEACWLVFLATHCGKNVRTGWDLCANLYAGKPGNSRWTWSVVERNPGKFKDWLHRNHAQIGGNFGNHRKYESLKSTGNGTGAVVESYVNWVRMAGSHREMFDSYVAAAAGNPRQAFHALYKSMDVVRRFGRTGRFDYLTMISKLGLASIEADATYMGDATGPAKGARLLFDGAISSKTLRPQLEFHSQQLEKALSCGMQVVEDSLCNWQKSPNQYVSFRG
jgi:hypothetical protein